jgi:hypothetical protein
MTASTPIQIDGKTYDRYSLNLAISGRYLGDGSSDANVAMRLVPTRLENGEVITADEAAQSIALGSLADVDAATQQAVVTIQAALQSYLQAKGL